MWGNHVQFRPGKDARRPELVVRWGGLTWHVVAPHCPVAQLVNRTDVRLAVPRHRRHIRRKDCAVLAGGDSALAGVVAIAIGDEEHRMRIAIGEYSSTSDFPTVVDHHRLYEGETRTMYAFRLTMEPCSHKNACSTVPLQSVEVPTTCPLALI